MAMRSNSFLSTRHLIVIFSSIALFSLIFMSNFMVVTGVPFYFILIIFSSGIFILSSSKIITNISIQEFFILIFIFWLFVSTINAYIIFNSFLQLYYYLISFILFFLIRRICFSGNYWFFLSASLLLGGFITSILMVVNFNDIFRGERVSINGINSNYLAYSLITLLPVLYIFIENKKISIICYFLLLFFSLAIFLTGSRGALISLIIFNLFLSFKKPFFGLILLLVALSFFTAVVGFYDSLPQYWQSRFDFKNSASSGIDWTSGRDVTWSAAIKIFENNYIFGIGLNNFSDLSGGGINVHNVFLGLLVEIGIFGFLSYFLIFFSILFFIYKRNVFIAFMLFFIEMPIFLTGVWESSPVLWVVLSLLMAYVNLFDCNTSRLKKYGK